MTKLEIAYSDWFTVYREEIRRWLPWETVTPKTKADDGAKAEDGE